MNNENFPLGVPVNRKPAEKPVPDPNVYDKKSTKHPGYMENCKGQLSTPKKAPL